MTLTDLEKMEVEVLTPTQVAKVLGCAPYSINVMAKQDKSLLGFPVMMVGNRVKIPRQAFIRWMRGGAGGNA